MKMINMSTHQIHFALLTSWILMSHVAHFREYEPCELAQEIYSLRDTDVERVLDILMCVAAFHDFNSTSIRKTPDDITHYGIFGITSRTWYWRGRYGGREVHWGDPKSDSLKFIADSLQLDSSLDEVAVSYYRRICTEPENEVYEIRCHLSDYVMGDYPLILPTHDLLYSRFQFPNETRIVTEAHSVASITSREENTTTRSTTTTNTSNSTDND